MPVFSGEYSSGENKQKSSVSSMGERKNDLGGSRMSEIVNTTSTKGFDFENFMKKE